MTLGERSVIGGRYRLVSQIGRGGMGTVWRAHDELLNRDVAVKAMLFPPELTEAEYDVINQRALREARLAARLSHPGIVTIHDVIEEDGRPWIVMELVDGRPLDQVVDQDGPLSGRRAAELGIQLADALTAAHEAGVLHRDVKPSNVLVSRGRFGRAVLTDFGVARARTEATISVAGGLVGSPAYIAPERARGRDATPEADLWSLGVTLYCAVEGNSPFERPETVAILVAVQNQEPAPMRHAGPLGPVIEGLLRKDPAERMTAAEAVTAFERILADLPGEPSPFARAGAPNAEETAGTDDRAEAHSAADSSAAVNAKAAHGLAAGRKPEPDSHVAGKKEKGRAEVDAVSEAVPPVAGGGKGGNGPPRSDPDVRTRTAWSYQPEAADNPKPLRIRRQVELPETDIEAADGLRPAASESAAGRDPVASADDKAAADADPAPAEKTDGKAPAEPREQNASLAEKEPDAAQARDIAVAAPLTGVQGDEMPPDRPKKPVLAAVAIGGAVLLAVPILLIGTGSHHGKKQRTAAAANTVLPRDGQPPGAYTSTSPSPSARATPKPKATKSAEPKPSAKPSPGRRTHRRGGVPASEKPTSGGNPYALEVHAPYDLDPGKTLRTNRIALTMQTGGDLVLRDTSGKIIWSSGTHAAGAWVKFQTDGNMVMYGIEKVFWQSGTPGHNGATLVLQADDNMVIFDGHTALWATGTNR
jgi:hypothetical protein